MSKRVVVTQLSKPGAVKEILATPKFPKVQAKHKESAAGDAQANKPAAGGGGKKASRWKKTKSRGKVEPLPPALVAKEAQERRQVQVVVQQPANPAAAVGASSTPNQPAKAEGKGHQDHEEHKAPKGKDERKDHKDAKDAKDQRNDTPDKGSESRIAAAPKPGAQVKI